MSQEPLGSPVPGPQPGAQGDPHKGAEENPGGPWEEARRVAGRAQPSALAAPSLWAEDGGGRLKRPWVSPKVLGESIFLEILLSAAWASLQGSSCAAPLPLARNA